MRTLTHNFSKQQAKHFLACWDRQNDLLSIYKKIYVSKMKTFGAAPEAPSSVFTVPHERLCVRKQYVFFLSSYHSSGKIVLKTAWKSYAAEAFLLVPSKLPLQASSRPSDENLFVAQTKLIESNDTRVDTSRSASAKTSLICKIKSMKNVKASGSQRLGNRSTVLTP